MDKVIEFFAADIPRTIGIIMMFGMFAYLGYEAHVHKTDLWHAIKGPDNKLHLSEIPMALWIVLFPTIVLSNLFLGLKPDPQITFSMDIILAVILGVKHFRDAKSVLDSNKETPKKEEEEPKSEKL